MLGIHHGVFCVKLLLEPDAADVRGRSGELGWKLMLGAVMAVEKNLLWGRRLSAPLEGWCSWCGGSRCCWMYWQPRRHDWTDGHGCELEL
jgi:hypothetical protein